MDAHYTLRTNDENRVFFEKKSDYFDVTKCLQQIEKPDLLHVCAYSNEQPSNLKTMDNTDFYLTSEITIFQ